MLTRSGIIFLCVAPIDLPDHFFKLCTRAHDLATAAQAAELEVRADAQHLPALDVRAGKAGPIPRELQNVHADGTGFEREQGYKYPHSYPGHWVQQQYLPDELKGKHYYEYGDNKTERAAAQYWEAIKG